MDQRQTALYEPLHRLTSPGRKSPKDSPLRRTLSEPGVTVLPERVLRQQVRHGGLHHGASPSWDISLRRTLEFHYP